LSDSEGIDAGVTEICVCRLARRGFTNTESKGWQMWLDKGADFIEKRIEPFTRWINAMGACTALIMVVLVAAHVLTRALFRKPLIGTVELEELMIVILVFLGMAYTQVQGKHISVDFLTSRFSEKNQTIISAATAFLTTGLLFALSWQSTFLSLTYLNKGVATFELRIPLFWLMWLVAIGFFLFGVVLLKDFLRAASSAIRSGRTFGLIVAVTAALVFETMPFWFGLAKFEPDLKTAQIFGLVALLLLLFSGMLIGAVLALLGFLGMAALYGPGAGFGLLKTVPISTTSSYSLCVIPFFILMGEICFHSGLSEKLYRAAYKWVGSLRGGLSMASVLACGAFSAVSGSSLATAATMGTVSLPEMKRYKYSESLATGSIAAGGTLGILIPPSVILIIYGVLVEVSIADLFFAGIVPGLIMILYYVITIHIWSRLDPAVGPPGPKASFGEKVRSLRDTWEVLCLFILIMGGIYGGLFTPTEAGAIGAAGALLFGLLRKRISRKNLYDSLLATGRTTSMVFLIVIGTAIYGYFLTSTQLPMELANFVVSADVPPFVVVMAIVMVCFALGCVMGTLPLVFITVPIFAPVMETLGYDLTWFGIIMVVVSEIGLITPPVGMNVFIIKGVAGDVPLGTIFRGIFPFLIADFACLITLIAFPSISLFLPHLLK
jgi:tripartite ATP-independent transporter DctM subunit